MTCSCTPDRKKSLDSCGYCHGKVVLCLPKYSLQRFNFGVGGMGRSVFQCQFSHSHSFNDFPNGTGELDASHSAPQILFSALNWHFKDIKRSLWILPPLLALWKHLIINITAKLLTFVLNAKAWAATHSQSPTPGRNLEDRLCTHFDYKI